MESNGDQSVLPHSMQWDTVVVNSNLMVPSVGLSRDRRPNRGPERRTVNGASATQSGQNDDLW